MDKINRWGLSICGLIQPIDRIESKDISYQLFIKSFQRCLVSIDQLNPYTLIIYESDVSIDTKYLWIKSIHTSLSSMDLIDPYILNIYGSNRSIYDYCL